jgi:hypothetical protein
MKMNVEKNEFTAVNEYKCVAKESISSSRKGTISSKKSQVRKSPKDTYSKFILLFQRCSVRNIHPAVDTVKDPISTLLAACQKWLDIGEEDGHTENLLIKLNVGW